LDLGTVGPLSDHLLVCRHDRVLTIDFSDLTFMDSTGMNLLVKVQQHMRDAGGKLVLYGIRPAQRIALDAVGLLDYFDSIVPD
jgi:anti-anti-sigma factor